MMKKYKLNDFKGGWFIGDFEPSLEATPGFEVAVKYYKKGDTDAVHFHKVADEYTVIVSGKYLINKKEYSEGDIIHFEPNDISNFKCLEDGATAVVKIPSVKVDKYIVTDYEK